MIITFIDAVLYSTYFLLLFFSIFWMLVLFSKEEEAPKPKLNRRPFFSVIVPAYNEEASITATLQSLVELDYPRELLEILVVNDGSKDKTSEKVMDFISKHPESSIRLHNQENTGKGRAMNNGLKMIKGEFFACLDADSFVAPNAIKEMLPYFEDKEVAAVCPLLKVKKPDTVILKVQWCEYIINMFHRYLNSKLNCLHVTPGPFSVYRTQVIRDLGGYNEKTITEDLEIAIRLQKHNYKIMHTFDTSVETMAPTTWKALFWQRIRWYKGSVENTFAYKELIFNKKYGDFGYIRMPTILLSGILAIVLTGALIYEAVRGIYHSFLSLQAVNFDIFTLLMNFSFDFNWLKLPLSKYFIAFTLAVLSLAIMVLSYRVIKEKITNYGKTFTTMITYLFLYGLFLTAVWVYIAILFAVKKKDTWYK